MLVTGGDDRRRQLGQGRPDRDQGHPDHGIGYIQRPGHGDRALDQKLGPDKDAGEAEVGDEADEEAERGYEGEVEYEVEAVSEPAYAEVAIPRPEEPVTADSPAQPEVPATGEEQRQQKLFGAGVDEGLVQEAQELLARGRRPTASLLQRKLRIDYELAQDLLQELERRGVVAADGRRG